MANYDNTVTTPGACNPKLLAEEIVALYPDLNGEPKDNGRRSGRKFEVKQGKGGFAVEWMGRVPTKLEMTAIVTIHNPSGKSAGEITELETQEAQQWLRQQYAIKPDQSLRISARRLIALLGLRRTE